MLVLVLVLLGLVLRRDAARRAVPGDQDDH
jgi:hypothetical protein